MVSARRLVPLLVLLATLASLTRTAAPPSSSLEKTIGRLIDELRKIDESGLGYSPTMTESDFLPLGASKPGAMLLGGKAPTPSAAMREIVGHGAAAVPVLIAQLGDDRPTKISHKQEGFFGGMFFRDEYDWNRRTTDRAPRGVNREGFRERNHPDHHTVTVGDLCFVALGQIVNRRFDAVRYQPTACIMINSPTYSGALRNAVISEWGGLTSSKLEASLVHDFQEPDFEDLRTGAAIRLGYYYPQSLESLVLRQLATPRYDVFEVEELIREQLYPAKGDEERKATLDAFVAKKGAASRDGVLLYLFEDLDSQIADEEGRLSPPLNGKYQARQCLIGPFGYSKQVGSSEKPYVRSVENCTQARFIDAIAFFQTAKIDQSVRQVMHSTEEDSLVRSCAKYLAGRGADGEIRKYVNQRLKGADAERRQQLVGLQEQIGWTPLHAAAESGEQAKMEGLIRRSADLDARASNGQTPLHVAAERGEFKIVRFLVKQKANLDIKDRQGMTPVQLAARNHFEGTVESLLDGGAGVPDILVATYAGRADLVDAFSKEDPTRVRVKTGWGETPLHLAATYNHATVVKVLLANGADVNAADGESKLTPLHRAASYSGREVIELLLEHKADRNAKSWDGKTPLDFARDRQDEDIVRLLDKGR